MNVTNTAALALAAAALLQLPARPMSLRLTVDRVQQFEDAADQGLPYLPGEVLVKFKPGMQPADEDRALTALRSRPSSSDLQWIRDVAILHDASQPNAQILADQLSLQPEVEYAVPDYIVHPSPVSRAETASMPLGPRPAAAATDPQFSLLQWNFPAAGIARAWDINPGGSSSVTVAVIDTGMTTASQSLTFPLWTGSTFQNFAIPFAASPDFSSSRITGAKDYVFAAGGGAVLDMDGHGTHVASTIAEETNNGVGVAGIAYHVKVMPMKVCVGYWEMMIVRAQAGIPGFLSPSAGGCSVSQIAIAIYAATDAGAKVINMSLGGVGAEPTVRDALNYAVQHGTFVAISMGNDYEDGNPTEYPSSYARDIAGVMSVGATGKSNTRAYYSSTGNYCEIAAPGGSSQDGSGNDRFIWQVTLDFSKTDPLRVVSPVFDAYAIVGMNGTSMASPHVAAVAALIMSQSPGITPAAVETLIDRSALDLGPTGRDDQYGFGLIQAGAALRGQGIIK